MEYSFELSLKRLCMNTIASSFWELQEIKSKIRQQFRREHFQNLSESKDTTWIDINKNVLQQVDVTILPKLIKKELYHMVTSIGSKIFDWMEYVLKDLYCNVSLAEHIYWTPHGLIDKVKIFKLVWLNNPMLFSSKLFNIACNYCLKEYINSLWQQIPKKIQKSFFYKTKIFSEYKHHLVAYWKHYLEGNSHFFITFLIRYGDPYSLYELDHSVQENMFELSVWEGYERAAKYFWKELNEQEKKRILHKNAKVAIQRSKCITSIEKKDAYLEIYIFLITKMSEEQKIVFLEENKNIILENFLNVWPWQEFFIPTLKHVCYCLTEKDFGRLIVNITLNLNEDCETGLPIQNSKYRNIFHQVWNESSACLKQSIDQDECSILSCFLRYGDIWTLNFVLNDRDMKERKKELIHKEELYTNLIKEDKYDVLEDFIKRVLISEGEKEEFKNNFDNVDICFYFLRDFRYSSAEKFLNWQLGSLEQIENFKKDFAYKQADCWRNKIYYTWYSDDSETAQKKIFELLKWLLVTDEAIVNFKKEMLMREELEKYIETNITHDDDFETTEEFLRWCLFSTNDIKELRTRFEYKKALREENDEQEDHDKVDEEC